MPQVDGNKPRFWRSVEDYAKGDSRKVGANGYPELVGREFPVGATEMDGATRRDFMKLVGLTAAGTMAACMRNPPERILPYARQPADMRPGLPLHYATTMSLDGYGIGLIVTAREGRPIKVEGNPDHPSSLGASAPSSRRSRSASMIRSAARSRSARAPRPVGKASSRKSLGGSPIGRRTAARRSTSSTHRRPRRSTPGCVRRSRPRCRRRTSPPTLRSRVTPSTTAPRSRSALVSSRATTSARRASSSRSRTTSSKTVPIAW